MVLLLGGLGCLLLPLGCLLLPLGSLVLPLGCLVLPLGCLVLPLGTVSPSVELDARERRIALRLSPLPELPPSPTNRVADDPRAQQLGQLLFFDPGLSGTGEIACASCHDPTEGWSDGQSLARGVETIERHTQSLFNVAHNRWYFWDGRADTLWSQALDPLEEPREMGTTRVAVARHIFRSPALRQSYETLFGPLPELDESDRFPADARPIPGKPDHPHHRAWLAMTSADRALVDRAFVNVGKALEAFERRLISTDAPFDRWVLGLRDGDPEKLSALSAGAQRGFRLFVGKAGCRTCHFGPNFTDREFHNTRVPPLAGGPPGDPGRYRGVERLQANPFNAKSVHSDQRQGRAQQKLDAVVNGPRFWSSFKTPSLRSVSRSAPYMHQGQFESLRRVIEYYNTLEGATTIDHHAETVLTPLGLTDAEIDDLVAFLESLDGAALDPKLVEAPRSK